MTLQLLAVMLIVIDYGAHGIQFVVLLWKKIRVIPFIKLKKSELKKFRFFIMETKFKHSIKVPMQYKKAAKVLKNSLEKGASVKEQIFTEKHAVN